MEFDEISNVIDESLFEVIVKCKNCGSTNVEISDGVETVDSFDHRYDEDDEENNNIVRHGIQLCCNNCGCETVLR